MVLSKSAIVRPLCRGEALQSVDWSSARGCYVVFVKNAILNFEKK